MFSTVRKYKMKKINDVNQTLTFRDINDTNTNKQGTWDNLFIINQLW